MKNYLNYQTSEELDLSKVEILKDNAMLKHFPHLWVEWDFNKNDELGYDIWKITKGMAKRAWWLCEDCGSSYDMYVYNKISSISCPYCAGKKVNSTNSLASLRPDIASQWHPTLNGDLTPHDVTCGSHKKVFWICDKCKNFNHQIVYAKVRGDSCSYCSGRYASEYNNLKVKNPKLAKEWHPTKNEDLTPYDVLHKSNKKVWWICDKGHEWDATIYNRNNEHGCPYCTNQRILKGFNDMWTTNPELASLLANPEDGYRYTESGSSYSTDWICSQCGEMLKNKTISQIKNKGLSCLLCSDGRSLPEKVFSNFLNKICPHFHNDTSFEWSENKRYDFYIPSYSMIIEVHGIQHYNGSFATLGGRSLEEEQENDQHKYDMAIGNGIENYIVIDARKSELNWIKNSILNSKLNDVFDLSKINWQEISEKSSKNIVFEISEMWNAELSINEIVQNVKLSRTTVRKYLKLGSELGLTNYVVKKRKCEIV